MGNTQYIYLNRIPHTPLIVNLECCSLTFNIQKKIFLTERKIFITMLMLCAHMEKIEKEAGKSMYKERMFETWRIGLIHLVIVVGMPIIPVVIYLITEGTGRAYLYALILTVVVPFLYEYMNPPYDDCGKFLRFESILCSVVLVLMLLGSLFLLFLSFTVEEENLTGINLAFWSNILIAMFSVPVIITIIEIIRCIVDDFNSGGYWPDDENIVRGAANV